MFGASLKKKKKKKKKKMIRGSQKVRSRKSGRRPPPNVINGRPLIGPSKPMRDFGIPGEKMQLDVGSEPPFRDRLESSTSLEKGKKPITPLWSVQTDRQTESDAYEPTVQCAQVGPINEAR